MQRPFSEKNPTAAAEEAEPKRPSWRERISMLTPHFHRTTKPRRPLTQAEKLKKYTQKRKLARIGSCLENLKERVSGFCEREEAKVEFIFRNKAYSSRARRCGYEGLSGSAPEPLYSQPNHGFLQPSEQGAALERTGYLSFAEVLQNSGLVRPLNSFEILNDPTTSMSDEELWNHMSQHEAIMNPGPGSDRRKPITVQPRVCYRPRPRSCGQPSLMTYDPFTQQLSRRGIDTRVENASITPASRKESRIDSVDADAPGPAPRPTSQAEAEAEAAVRKEVGYVEYVDDAMSAMDEAEAGEDFRDASEN